MKRMRRETQQVERDLQDQPGNCSIATLRIYGHTRRHVAFEFLTCRNNSCMPFACRSRAGVNA